MPARANREPTMHAIEELPDAVGRWEFRQSGCRWFRPGTSENRRPGSRRAWLRLVRECDLKSLGMRPSRRPYTPRAGLPARTTTERPQPGPLSATRIRRALLQRAARKNL